MNYEKQNETRIFRFGEQDEITFLKTTNKLKMKKNVEKKTRKKKRLKENLTSWIELQAPKPDKLSPKLQNWNSNKNKQKVEMG